MKSFKLFDNYREGKSENMGKYKDDGLPTFEKIPEEDIEEAAKEYGEGYEPLINCLKICWQNNIQTFACCSGHEIEDEETHKKSYERRLYCLYSRR